MSPAFKSKRRERVESIEQYVTQTGHRAVENVRTTNVSGIAEQLVHLGDRVVEGRESTPKTVQLLERADLPWRAGEWAVLRVISPSSSACGWHPAHPRRRLLVFLGVILGIVLGLIVPPMVLRLPRQAPRPQVRAAAPRRAHARGEQPSHRLLPAAGPRRGGARRCPSRPPRSSPGPWPRPASARTSRTRSSRWPTGWTARTCAGRPWRSGSSARSVATWPRRCAPRPRRCASARRCAATCGRCPPRAGCPRTSSSRCRSASSSADVKVNYEYVSVLWTTPHRASSCRRHGADPHGHRHLLDAQGREDARCDDWQTAAHRSEPCCSSWPSSSSSGRLVIGAGRAAGVARVAGHHRAPDHAQRGRQERAPGSRTASSTPVLDRLAAPRPCAFSPKGTGDRIVPDARRGRQPGRLDRSSGSWAPRASACSSARSSACSSAASRLTRPADRRRSPAAAGFFLPDLLVYNAGLKRQDRAAQAASPTRSTCSPSAWRPARASTRALLQVARSVDRADRRRVRPRAVRDPDRQVPAPQAFAALGERTTAPEVKTFVSALVQADRLGPARRQRAARADQGDAPRPSSAGRGEGAEGAGQDPLPAAASASSRPCSSSSSGRASSASWTCSPAF